MATLGSAERISEAESLTYFASRPFGSHLGAWVSQQSAVISSLRILELKLGEITRHLDCGFRGFRQGRANRLHDRFRYRQTGARGLGDRAAWRRSCRRCHRRRPSVSASLSQGVEGLNLPRGKSKAQITCGTGYAHLQWHAITRDGVEATGVVLG